MIGRCSICGKWRLLWFRTPVDPPFYPSTPERHCRKCQNWLLTGN